MTRQFKLVTDKEYDLLKKMRTSGSEGVVGDLKESKDQIWKSDIPEELKAMLYQDYMRRILKKKKDDENKPVPVKVTSSSTKPVQHEVGTDPEEPKDEEEEEEDEPEKTETPIYHSSFQIFGVQKKMTHLKRYFDEQGYSTKDGGLTLGGTILNPEESLGLMRSLTDGRVPMPESSSPAVEYLKKKKLPLMFVASNKQSLFQGIKKWNTLDF